MCSNAYNGINGRMCNELRRYVEHIKEPLCNIINKKHETEKR